MAFIETPRFFDTFSLGSGGGPEYSTSIVRVISGVEYRKQRRGVPVHRYTFGVGNKTSAEIDEVRKQHHACLGMLTGFRIKDYNDFSSAASMATAVTKDDQALGNGDGTTVDFQIIKNYTVGTETLARTIKKIVSGTLLVAVGGALQTETTHYTVDYDTGIITFNTAPGAGSSPLGTPAITAGYQFDVPVRFGSDLLQIQQISPGIEVGTVDLVEDLNA